MIFASAPSALHRRTFGHPARTLESYLEGALHGAQEPNRHYAQDDTHFTLTLDMPGISRDQLSISIEDAIVRIASKEGAARNYRAAYEFPLNIDTTASEARLENGVLTLKLAKLKPVKNVTELTIQ